MQDLGLLLLGFMAFISCAVACLPRICTKQDIWDGCYQEKHARTQRCKDLYCYYCTNQPASECTSIRRRCEPEDTMNLMEKVAKYNDTVYVTVWEYLCVSIITGKDDNGNTLYVRGCLLQNGRENFDEGNIKSHIKTCYGCTDDYCNDNDITERHDLVNCFEAQ